MTNWARRRRARGVRAALAWVACDMKTSWLERFLRQLHSTSGGLHPSTRQIDSSQRLDQRAWASHLGAAAASAVEPDGPGLDRVDHEVARVPGVRGQRAAYGVVGLGLDRQHHPVLVRQWSAQYDEPR